MDGLKVTSKQAAWVDEMTAKGVSFRRRPRNRQVWKGKCGGSCGSSCFGVCPHNPVTSESFCMCFPKGYEGISGKFHPGASCLKQCGTGETAEVARKGKDTHKAYAEGE